MSDGNPLAMASDTPAELDALPHGLVLALANAMTEARSFTSCRLRPTLFHCFFDRFLPGLFFKSKVVGPSFVFRLGHCRLPSKRPLRQLK
jgi:hypothetical protein